jgi:hypothetical protein
MIAMITSLIYCCDAQKGVLRVKGYHGDEHGRHSRRRWAMSAIIPCFADAMIKRHGPMASAHAMQHAVDCRGAGDEYGESFWLWVSDLTSLATSRPGTPGTNRLN